MTLRFTMQNLVIKMNFAREISNIKLGECRKNGFEKINMGFFKENRLTQN